MRHVGNVLVPLIFGAVTIATACHAYAQDGTIPAAPAGRAVSLDREFADSVARGAFGLEWTGVAESVDRFIYEIKGFRDSRRCPLEGIRDVGCDNFEWTPSRFIIYRDAWDGALSGHLALNRAVAVDLSSDSAPFSIGSMHGVLVVPSSGIDSRKKPSFGWYLSRSGSSVAMSFMDVSGDGLEDVVYTYRQRMPGGVLVVPRDVWSFRDMIASKYLSSGEKLSGVSTSTFEGVPFVLESEERHELGRFIFRKVRVAQPLSGQGQVQIITVERGVFAPAGPPSWELQVLADVGSGWFDYLSIVGTPCETGPSGPDDETGGLDFNDSDRCAFSELPPDAPIEVRRSFLDIEGVCRFADQPVDWDSPVLRAAVMMFRGVSLTMAGYPMLGSVFYESAAVEIEAIGGQGFPLSMVAAAAAVSSTRDICDVSSGNHCWNDPGSESRGLIADWILELPGFSSVVWKAFSAWLEKISAID